MVSKIVGGPSEELRMLKHIEENTRMTLNVTRKMLEMLQRIEENTYNNNNNNSQDDD